MHSMLKKSLLAMAVAAASVANVQAQTITGSSSTAVPSSPAIVVSSEGLAIDPTLTVGPAGEVTVNYTTNAVINDGDIVTVNFNGASVLAASAGTAGFVGQPNLGFLSISDTGISFRLTSGGVDIPANTTLVLDGVTLGSVTSSVSASAQSQIPGIEDPFNVAPDATIAVVASQFSFNRASGTGASDTNRVFDGTIDVEQMRMQFTADSVTAGTPPGTSNRVPDSAVVDNFFVRFSGANADVKVATVTDATVALTGEDLGFLLDANGNLDAGGYNITGLIAAVEATGTDAATLVGNTLTVSTTNDPGGYVGIELDSNGVNQLNAQTFSADLEIGYQLGGTADSIPATGFDAGEWDLNGAAINIPFLPFGPNFAQVIRISNDSNAGADIELTAFDNEGNTFGPVILPTAAPAGTVHNPVAEITAALLDAGFDGSGEIDITLVINASAGDIDVVANYRVLSANDRVAVPVIALSDD